MGAQADELVTAMNRAAEAAVPEAKTLLVDSVKQMSVQDVTAILTGPEDAATQYFRRTTSEKLAAKFLPIVQKATATAGSAFFFADADLNSGNMIMTVPMTALGLVPGQTISFSVYASDNYFSGITSDAIEGMKFTPGNERFGLVDGPFGALDPKSSATLGVKTATLPDTVSSERGLLLIPSPPPAPVSLVPPRRRPAAPATQLPLPATAQGDLLAEMAPPVLPTSLKSKSEP